MPVIPAARCIPAVLATVALLLVPAAATAQEGSPPSLTAEPTASPAPSMASPAGAWLVRAYDAWGEGPVGPLPDSRLMLTLLADGDLEGETGCGRFTGGWSADDGELFMGVAPTGNLGCGEQQAAEAIGLSTAIDAVAGWRTTDTGIELVDADCATRLALEAIDLGDPTGAWDVRRYRRPNGRLVEPLPGSPMMVTLAADGTVTGSTGCRLIVGEYRYEGAGIILGPLETEGLPCDDERNRPERQLLRALGEAAYWQQDGATLSLTDGFDELVAELERVAEPTATAEPEG